MQVMIRTHVKNERRFALLTRTIESAIDKGFTQEGNKIVIVDDCSPEPWKRTIELYSEKQHNVFLCQVPHESGNTKQGLAYSLFYSNPTNMAIHCVDDMVFGKGAYEEFQRIEKEYIPKLEKVGIQWGMIGTFACYDRHASFNSIPLWHYPAINFYAGVCHVINPMLGALYVDEYRKLQGGLPVMIDPIHADDLWIKGMCMETGYQIFNTLKDYAQHTGMECRTFGDEKEPSSNYTSNHFVGE